MSTEDTLIQWFTAHPFWRNEVILILGAWGGLAKADWASFKDYQADNPAATFQWKLALYKYSHALIIAGVPPLLAEVWKILGAVGPAMDAASAAAPSIMVSLHWAGPHLFALHGSVLRLVALVFG